MAMTTKFLCYRERRTYTVGVVVVVKVFVAGILRYELQNVVAGAPRPFRILNAPVTLAQLARSRRCASGVGSGRAEVIFAVSASTKHVRVSLQDTMLGNIYELPDKMWIKLEVKDGHFLSFRAMIY